MNKNLILTLICAALASNIYPQQFLDRYIAHSDSVHNLIDSLVSIGTFDTIINNKRYLKISSYSPNANDHSIFYHDKLKFKDNKLIGEYFYAEEEECKPCYFYDYTQNGVLINEGLKLANGSQFGTIIEYFHNGKISHTYILAFDSINT